MKAFLSLLLWCGTLTATAQPRISVEVSRSLSPGDERYTLQYSIEGAKQVSQFVPPPFRGLELLQGPDQTQGFTLANGELTPYVNISYVLRPLGKGRILLPAASAKADGQLLHSRVVELAPDAVNAAGPERAGSADLDDYVLHKGETVYAKTKGNLFVKLVVNRTRCFIGEPLMAEYKLYTRLNSESHVTKRPSFNGFSVYDMMPPESGAVLQERVGGKAYNVYTLRKVLLYPLQEGTYSLESMEVENLVNFVRAESLAGKPLAEILGAFGSGNAPDGSVVKETVTVSNPPQSIEVKPLPLDAKPAGFNGAVGRFTMMARLKEREMHAGDVRYLDIVVSGKGNLPILARPTVDWPKGVETYEDSIREDYNQFRDPDNWQKTFTIPFSPRKAGRMVIPQVTLVYFDPDSGRYRSTTTTPLELNVLPPVHAGAVEEGTSKDGNGQTDRIWLLLPAALILGIVLLFFWQRSSLYGKAKREAFELKMEKEDIRSVAQEALVAGPELTIPVINLEVPREKAREGDAQGFYRWSEKVLKDWMQVRHGVPPTARKEELRQTMGWAGKDPVLTEELVRFLQDCELVRFSPLLDGDRLLQDLERLERLTEALLKREEG